MSEKTKQNNTKMNKQNRSNKRSSTYIREEKKRKNRRKHKNKRKHEKHLDTHLIFCYYVELKDSRHLSTPVLKFVYAVDRHLAMVSAILN